MLIGNGTRSDRSFAKDLRSLVQTFVSFTINCSLIYTRVYVSEAALTGHEWSVSRMLGARSNRASDDEQVLLGNGSFVVLAAVVIHAADLGHCISIGQPARQRFFHGSDYRAAPRRFYVI